MKNVLLWAVTMILGAIIFLAIQAYANETQAHRFQAQAALIREQSQARLDLATALMPYVALTVVVVTLASLAAVVIYALGRRPDASQSTRIIESRTILILQPGEHTKREIFKLLSGGNER